MSAATWSCASCHAANARHRDRCLRCKSARPELVAATAAAAVASGALALPAAALPPPSAWAEALDVATRQIYYYNAATGETSWDRPAALGAAPLASGWFGRGAVGTSGAQAALLARNAAWLQRPARKQADLDPSRLQRAEGANEYNLWWGRFIGDSWRGGMGREPAPTRCAPEQDAGWTKATLAALTERAAFCIHFARGGCAKGSDCTYHHRVPSAEDDGALDTSRDIFGRERHASHRDDMGGVGSMMSNCRTLYVGGLKRPPEVAAAAASAALAGGGGAAAPGRSGGGGGGSAALPPMPPPALMAAWESEVAAHFSPWGELESLNVIPRLAVAFVRYRYRAGAEFALAAMANQSLGRGEVLNIRWAHDDPNPAAIAARARADEAAVTAALAARGIQLGVMAGPAEMPQPAAAAEEEGEALRLEAYRAAQVAQWQEEMRAAGGGGAGWSEAAREAGGEQARGEEEEAAAAAGAAAAQRKRARAAAAAEGEAAAEAAAAAAAHEAAAEAGAPAYTLGAAPPQLATYGSEAAAAGQKRQRAE